MKKQQNKISETTYPLWRSVAWRFIRAGVSGGISSLLAIQVVLRPDFSNVNLYATTLGSAFIAGFISATGLALRDYFGNSDRNEGVINKLPL